MRNPEEMQHPEEIPFNDEANDREKSASEENSFGLVLYFGSWKTV